MIDLILIAFIHSWRLLALFNLYHCSTCLISSIPANLKAYDFSPISRTGPCLEYLTSLFTVQLIGPNIFTGSSMVSFSRFSQTSSKRY